MSEAGQFQDGCRVLVVAECDTPDLDVGSVATLRYCYRFVTLHPADGFSAWEAVGQGEAEQGRRVFDVAEHCRSLEGGFRQQALNRFVAQAIIREAPVLLVIHGLWGCTADLPRIADMMGVPTILVLGDDQPLPDEVPDEWLCDALRRCRVVMAGASSAAAPAWLECAEFVSAQDPSGAGLSGCISRMARDAPAAARAFSYSTYEFVLRDHPLLSRMQESDTRHFQGLEHVLDVACGAGIFLESLGRQGIRATGVERDPVVATYGSGMGLDIVNRDALEYLRAQEQHFDGVYCSHFVEHLPIDVVAELLALLYGVTAPGGVVVLVFPDPESIRSQLLGFWRDPEHVRFYHPELIASMATVQGFQVEWSSYDEQPHEVIPFSENPGQLPAPAPMPSPPVAPPPTAWSALLGLLGLQSTRSARENQEQWRAWAGAVTDVLGRQQDFIDQVAERTDTLWRLNHTWAWNDNATIRLRRGGQK